MAADAASSLTTCRDDLACSYQTCRKVITFTRRFLVTDLATLTGSGVEDFQTPKFSKVTATSFSRGPMEGLGKILESRRLAARAIQADTHTRSLPTFLTSL